MPSVSFVNVVGVGRDEVYTLIGNTGYSNITHLFKESKRLLPEEDSITVARGFIGAYPNYFFQVNESEIALFVNRIEKMTTAEDYIKLKENYGVHRNAPWFWSVSDKFHDMQKVIDPVNAGLLDFNRYQSH